MTNISVASGNDEGRILCGCGLCHFSRFFSADSEWRLRVSFAGGQVDVRRAGRRDQKLKGVVLFFFRAHGEKCRSDDHGEKYQCKDKIVDHWGVSFLAALAVFE